MRNRINCFVIGFCLLNAACKQNRQPQNSFDFKAPEVVEAKTYRISPENAAAPEIIPLTKVKKTLVGKPETVQLRSNIFTAKAERVFLAGVPEIIIPDSGGSEDPFIVPAIDSPFLAGNPDIITLRDSHIKENNSGSFSSIKAMDGLNSNEISSLCQDRMGNLWIGAWWGGVSKYDGRSLSNYSMRQGLSSDVVSCVFEDRTGNIWIATINAGVNKFDGKKFTRYSTKEGLSDNYVFNIMQDKRGDIWLATNNGLNRYNGQSFTHYTTAQGLPSPIIRGMLEDSKGNLWFGSSGGLSRFDGKRFQHYTPAFGMKNETEVVSITEGRNGSIWFATNRGLFVYDGKYISQFTTKSGLSSNRTSKIITDNHGDLWIGTWDGGANLYDGKTFTHFGAEQGVSNEVVTAVQQDRSGNIWLATTAGVCKYDGNLFSHVLPIRQEEIESVLADKAGNIWIGSGAGDCCLNKYDGHSIARYTTAQGLVNTNINQISEDRNGDIWFSTRGGAVKYDGHYFTNYSTDNGLADNTVFCIVEDKKGNHWIGTENGLSYFDGKCFTNYSVAQGLTSNSIYSLLEDHSGKIWMGTSDKGVSTFDGVYFTHFDIANSLSNSMVIGMMEDKNKHLWFCTGRGINKFDGRYFTWYTTEQGLSNNNVKNVLEDKNGNIWVGTINGMNRLLPDAVEKDSSLIGSPSYFKRFTISEGFSGGGTYENALTQESNGKIWIGANDRLTTYHPEGEIPDTIAPSIQISGIDLFDENINWQELEKKKQTVVHLKNGRSLKNVSFNGLSAWYNQPEQLKLKHTDNYIRFRFVGITTNRPKEVRYQYYLEGLDENWRSVTEQQAATYNNLPPGEFTFKIKAVNSERHWSKELNYSFVILPPWWQTWWAYLSYCLVFAIAIWMYVWYRSRWLKAENRQLEEKVARRTHELEESLEERYRLSRKIESQQALLNERMRISRELHDDIGSTLGSISIYSEVARKRTEKNENATEVLAKIGFASRELIDKMSDIIWSLHHGNENFEQLKNRMRAFAAMILAPKNIQNDFVTDKEVNKIHLTSEQGKNIFLIYKEALHNIAKYANCRSASISLRLENGVLIMIIHDDGKGFDLSGADAGEAIRAGEYAGRNGIRNMHTRAEIMKAELEIHSTINEGTTVQLSVPL